MRGLRKKHIPLAVLLLAAALLEGCGAAPLPETTPAVTAATPPVASTPEPQYGELHETIAAEGAAGIRVVGEYEYDPEGGLSFTLELANPWEFDNYFTLGLCLNGYTDYPGTLYLGPEGQEPTEKVSATACFTLCQPQGVSRYSVRFVPSSDSLIRSTADIRVLDQLAMTYMFYYHPDPATREFAQGMHVLPVGAGEATAEHTGEQLYSDGGDSIFFAGYNPESCTALLMLCGDSDGARYRLHPTLEGFGCLRFSASPEAEATEEDIRLDAARIPQGMVSLRTICVAQALEELGIDQPGSMSLRIWSAKSGMSAASVTAEAALPLDTRPEKPFGTLESYPVVMENTLFRLRLISQQGNALILAVENLTGLDMWLSFQPYELTGGEAAVYLRGESPCAIPPADRCTVRVESFNRLEPYADGSPGGDLSGETELGSPVTLFCKVAFSPGHEPKPIEIYEQTLALP